MSRRCRRPAKPVRSVIRSATRTARPNGAFLPNLLNVTLQSEVLRRSVRMRITANALKSVDHRGGFDAFLRRR